MTRSVLVTGGAGFIGSRVADAHLAAGHAVTVLDDLSTGRREHVPAGARFVHLDVRSPEAQELVAAGRFAVVNHHAAQLDVRRSVADPTHDASVNIIGLLNVLEGARRGGTRRVVFASSGGTIYGEGAQLPIDEDAAKLPLSPYGTSKLASEYYLATLSQLHGLESAVLRYSNVYGPRQNSHGEAGVVAIFGRRLLADQPLTVFGDGEQTRDMVYVEDVAEANVIAAAAPLPPLANLDSRAYNIGTGVETSVAQLVRLLGQAGGRAPRVVHAPERAGELRRNALRVDKAARELGWRPRTPLAEGLTKTLRWLAES